VVVARFVRTCNVCSCSHGVVRDDVDRSVLGEGDIHGGLFIPGMVWPTYWVGVIVGLSPRPFTTSGAHHSGAFVPSL
jgi:hypothetical protein